MYSPLLLTCLGQKCSRPAASMANGRERPAAVQRLRQQLLSAHPSSNALTLHKLSKTLF